MRPSSPITSCGKQPQQPFLSPGGLRISMMTLLLLATLFTRSWTADIPRISTQLKNKFESALSTLAPAVQRHYAIRMFRITGDDQYMPPIICDFEITLNELQDDVGQVNDSVYIQKRLLELLSDFNTRTRKGRLRAELFRNRGYALFYLNLLYSTNKLTEYATNGLGCDTLLVKSINILRRADLSALLLDTAVIRIYAPQAVNDICYLHDLGIIDLRHNYREAFRVVFPDSQDDSLTKAEFRDKIYGLTHFILAASGYYQQTVPTDEFQWILDYLDDNANRIMTEVTPDIIAEVGLCFLLTGQNGHRMVRRSREAILAAFDEQKHMILSPRGNDNLEKGEHRNILAYMLLNWPDSLHPGPYLKNPEVYREIRPE